nr:hypothetical protein [Chloroflexota bacterium]
MPPMILAAIASTCFSISIIAVLYWFLVARRGAEIGARVDHLAMESQSVEEYELSLPFSQRFVLPILRVVGRAVTNRTPSERMQEMRRKLVLAGNPGNLSVPEFMAIKLVVGLVVG